MLRLTPPWLKLGLVAIPLGLLLAGCASGPRSVPPVMAAAVEAAAEPVAEPEAGVRRVTVRVDTGDAIVVVNHQPVGLAPQLVELPVTDLGYLRYPIAVGVRFVARDLEEASFSVEEVLEVTDRAPASLLFSRDQPVRRIFGQSLR